jgi:hypothetical protein
MEEGREGEKEGKAKVDKQTVRMGEGEEEGEEERERERERESKAAHLLSTSPALKKHPPKKTKSQQSAATAA